MQVHPVSFIPQAMRNVSISSCGPFQVKLWKLQSPLLCSENSIIFFSQGDDTLQTGFTCLYSFDYECQCAGEKD